MVHIKKFNEMGMIKEESSDTIVLWADGITDNFEKAVKKAKVKGKGGKGWDKEYRTNAKAGHGTVFFIDAKNKEEALSKIKNAKKVDTNVYVMTNENINISSIKGIVDKYNRWKMEHQDEGYQYDEIFEFINDLSRGEVLNLMDYISDLVKN